MFLHQCTALSVLACRRNLNSIVGFPEITDYKEQKINWIFLVSAKGKINRSAMTKRDTLKNEIRQRLKKYELMKKHMVISRSLLKILKKSVY